MLEPRISLFQVAKVMRVSMPYAKIVLDGENVTPFKDCEELRFVTYLQADVEICFPEVEF